MVERIRYTDQLSREQAIEMAGDIIMTYLPRDYFDYEKNKRRDPSGEKLYALAETALTEIQRMIAEADTEISQKQGAARAITQIIPENSPIRNIYERVKLTREIFGEAAKVDALGLSIEDIDVALLETEAKCDTSALIGTRKTYMSDGTYLQNAMATIEQSIAVKQDLNFG